MILEVGLFALFLAGVFCVFGLLVLRARPRDRLRRQKAFAVLEAEVWVACAQKLQALDAPKHPSSGR
jgi:hypothetical protein